MWLGFLVITLIQAQAMNIGKSWPKVAALGHEPIQVQLGGFKKSSKGAYALPTGYLCLKCGKHLMQAFDFDGYVSEAEPCINANSKDICLTQLLEKLQTFEEFNQRRIARSHSI